MTTKQELFRMYLEQKVSRDYWFSKYAPEPEPEFPSYRMVRTVNTPTFTRACHFVARQLGLWEES